MFATFCDLISSRPLLISCFQVMIRKVGLSWMTLTYLFISIHIYVYIYIYTYSGFLGGVNFKWGRECVVPWATFAHATGGNSRSALRTLVYDFYAVAIPPRLEPAGGAKTREPK